MKIYFIDQTDMYGDHSCGYVAYASEAEADQVVKEREQQNGGIGYSYMTQELELLYSHRNGETVSPTVDGWYFVEYLGTITVVRNPVQDTDTTLAREKYYGPIPEPEF